MAVRFLPLVVGVTPIIATNLAFLIGVVFETVPACIPYIDGCVSISATGRTPPGSFLFRAVHLPYAAILAATWYFAWLWLRALAPHGQSRAARTSLVLGLVASIALVVYVTFLGTREPIYEFMRRGGIYFYFAGATFAQIIFTTALRAQLKQRHDEVLRRYASSMLWICLMPLALGIVNLGQKALFAKSVSDPIENSIEWIAALFMQAWFVVLFGVWRRSGFDINVALRRAE